MYGLLDSVEVLSIIIYGNNNGIDDADNLDANRMSDVYGQWWFSGNLQLKEQIKCNQIQMLNLLIVLILSNKFLLWFIELLEMCWLNLEFYSLLNDHEILRKQFQRIAVYIANEFRNLAQCEVQWLQENESLQTLKLAKNQNTFYAFSSITIIFNSHCCAPTYMNSFAT